MRDVIFATVLYCYPLYKRMRQWLQQPLVRRRRRVCPAIRNDWVVQVTEACLWVLAIGGLGSSLFTYAFAYAHQARQIHRVARIYESSRPITSSRTFANVSKTTSPVTARSDDLLGILEIPRLGILSAVEEGVSGATLAQAVGHIPGTKFPGEVGNSGLAAHRDTYFRRLGDVKPGDKITFKTANAEYIYTVEGSGIVDPGNTSVLSDSDGSTLTLVTCFPFHYIGPAPKRFIVTARSNRIGSPDPDRYTPQHAPLTKR